MTADTQQPEVPEMTPEIAMKLATTLNGPEGIEAFEAKIEQLLENANRKIIEMQGTVHGFAAVLRLLVAFKQQWARAVHVMQAEGTEKRQPEEVLPPEVRERIAKNQCAFKAAKKDGGKWCARKLATKPDRQTGYCAVHRAELGIDAPDDPHVGRSAKARKKPPA